MLTPPRIQSVRLLGNRRVDPELGTLVWPNGADICPDVLIHDLPPVIAPSED